MQIPPGSVALIAAVGVGVDVDIAIKQPNWRITKMRYGLKLPTSTILAQKILAGTVVAVYLATSASARQDPTEQLDESWISLGGTVTSSSADSFRLDYGDGMITVEMDDWDYDGDAFPLMDGDQVTVYGRVDQNLFANTTIEAGSVYVQDLNTFFYASAADEEEYGAWVVNVD